jgi:hypothetical protein
LINRITVRAEYVKTGKSMASYQQPPLMKPRRNGTPGEAQAYMIMKILVTSRQAIMKHPTGVPATL